MEKDILYGLQQGNAALREIQKEMSLEAVEKLMEETAEAVAYQKVLISPPPSCPGRTLVLISKWCTWLMYD